LAQRLIAAAIIIATMLVLVWLDFQLGTDAYLGRPGLLLSAFSLVMAGLAAAEMIDMWRPHTPRLSRRVGVCATVVMVVVASLSLLWRDYPANCPFGRFGWSLAGLILGLVIVFFYEMYLFSQSHVAAELSPPPSGTSAGEASGRITDRIAKYALALCYLQMMFGFLAAHRMIDNSNAVGLVSLITLMTSVKMSDAFAYFTGKSLGRSKLAPHLSPKKTVEGALGAFVGAWLGAAIVLFVVAPYAFEIQIQKPWWWFLVYGGLVTLAGMAGDLSVSLLKRDAHCKDSSKWLPGLGGILDVLDSLVFATPVSFLLWM
jgi:phosphatidate cytidylyltransferase